MQSKEAYFSLQAKTNFCTNANVCVCARLCVNVTALDCFQTYLFLILFADAILITYVLIQLYGLYFNYVELRLVTVPNWKLLILTSQHLEQMIYTYQKKHWPVSLCFKFHSQRLKTLRNISPGQCYEEVTFFTVQL